MPDSTKPILLRYGGASKSSFEMTTEELEELAKSVLRRAKEKAFYRGLPIYYKDSGNIIAEFPDGRKQVIKSIENVSTPLRNSGSQRNW
jgi:hypothetical protein